MNKKYTTTMEDAADGSGDGILTFPPELLADMGWKEGDSLDISINKFGVVIIKKLDNV
jgi:bifunctional DNA-binding transcriptional regulator/antitoxin component of YhaV-PrlF toxin-antitoxin module